MLLAQATEEATFRRETRTATFSIDAADNHLKRKWAFASNYVTDEVFRIKKQKKMDYD